MTPKVPSVLLWRQPAAGACVYTRAMRRLAWIAVGLAIIVAALLSAHRVFWSPVGRVVFHDAEAPWVMPVEPFSAMSRQWGREQAPRVRFAREWVLSSVPDSARLRVRAFGAFTLHVNDVPIPFDASDDRAWQDFQVRDVSAALRTGSNQIVVDVRNRRGPALLALALETGEAGRLTTAAGFSARIGNRPAEPAHRAHDVRRHPALAWLPTAGQGAAAHAMALGLVLLVGATLGAAVGPGLSSGGVMVGRRVGWGVAAAAGAFWCLLLGVRFIEMSLAVGFDARSHLEVVELIGRGEIPLATDGWSTYHPPLYHVFVAALAPVGDGVGGAFATVMRRLPAWLAGVGLIWMAARLARVLHPGRAGLQAVAVGFTALLPVNVYIAGAITNEGLLAFFAAGAVVWGVELLREPVPRPADVVAVSCWLGLALLTKYTALVAVAVVGVFALLHIVTANRSTPRTGLRDALLLVAPALALSGWFYVRNVAVYGRPLVPNWDLPGAARVWWSAPGFHTADYYTAFGSSLSQPYYASFVSFLDGLYSTLWADGLLSGAPGLQHLAVPWNLEWMAALVWIAVPITLLVVVGTASWLRETLRETDPQRAAALALPLVYAAAMVFAIFYATLSLPFFGQARASYGLSATPVLALAFARGLAVVGGWGSGRVQRCLHAALGAVCAAWAVGVAMAFLG